MEEQYKKALKSIRETEAILMNLETIKNTKKDTIVQEIKEAKQFPHIKDINICEEGIQITTDFIKITFKKKTYEIGRLKFTVGDLEGGKYAVENLDRKGGYPHPHATESGNMCFGDMNLYANEIYENFKVKEIIKLLIAWSFTYEPTNRPYAQIEYFETPIRRIITDEETQELLNANDRTLTNEQVQQIVQDESNWLENDSSEED